MRSPSDNDPRLFVTNAQEISLSGQALLELMRAVLGKGFPFRFCARGWSMAPFIRDGDVITVSPIKQILPKVGEVVAFTRPGQEKLVVHRVIARQKSVFLIQGDNSPESSDGSITPENLLGRVTRIERDGQDIWLGLGPERAAIAWFSRIGILFPLRVRFASWYKPNSRRHG